MTLKKHACPSYPHFIHGADYNPEQWLDYEGIWDKDMHLMKLANCNEMTVGIFSWAKLEPREGEYDFSFLDEIIERVGKNGGKVILSTPPVQDPDGWQKNTLRFFGSCQMGCGSTFGDGITTALHLLFTGKRYRLSIPSWPSGTDRIPR